MEENIFEITPSDLDIFRVVQNSSGLSIKDVSRALINGGMDKSEYSLYHRIRELSAAGYLELKKKKSKRIFGVYLTSKSRYALVKSRGDADA